MQVRIRTSDVSRLVEGEALASLGMSTEQAKTALYAGGSVELSNGATITGPKTGAVVKYRLEGPEPVVRDLAATYGIV